MTALRAGLIVLAFSCSLYAQTTYFVSSTGNDANAGTSRAAAWRTLGRVAELHTGDRLLLQGGATFRGTVRVQGNAVTLSSYGKGRATIDSGDATAIQAVNSSTLRISNLNLTGTSLSSKILGVSGVEITNSGPKLGAIDIEHVDISGYTLAGIDILSLDRVTGFDGITIDSVRIHEIGYVGINVQGEEVGTFFNVAVTHSEIYDVTGYQNAYGIVVQGSGSGITIAGATTGRIANNVIHENGTVLGGGAYAIQLSLALNFVIEENEVWDTNSILPGGGGGAIDVNGASEVDVRYNYTHGNRGAGVRICACVGPTRQITVRYNISENDGDPGAFDLEGSSGDANIFHNTIFAGDGIAIAASGSWPATIADNLLITTSGTFLESNDSVALFGNNYWDTAGAQRVIWKGTTYNSLSAWATASGEEGNGTALRNLDPQLYRSGDAGTMFPRSLSDLNAYRFGPSSGLIDAARALESSGIVIGPRDFFGDETLVGFATDIGAYEYTSDQHAPSLDPIATQTVLMGDAIDVDVWLHDADGTSGVTLSLLNAPSWASIKRVAGSHAILTLAPTLPGNATITVRATDDSGGTAEQSFVVNVTGTITKSRAVRRK
jgi:hypothetical protein